MDNRQLRTLASFEKVLLFLESYPINPEPPLLAGMQKSLRASIDRITKHGLTQLTAMELRHKSVERKRRVLRRERMMPLVRIAKPLLRYAPGTEKVLRVPHARADALTVATAALKLADVLQPHAKLLASAGLTKGFLAELRHEARELALSAKQTEAARQTSAKATAAIASEFRKAMKTVMVIEGLMMLHYAKDSSMLTLWRNWRRVSARIGRPRQRKSGGGAGVMTAATA